MQLKVIEEYIGIGWEYLGILKNPLTISAKKLIAARALEVINPEINIPNEENFYRIIQIGYENLDSQEVFPAFWFTLSKEKIAFSDTRRPTKDKLLFIEKILLSNIKTYIG